MKSRKKIICFSMLFTLIVVLAISVSAYQFGSNSQTKGSYTISGYIYTIGSTSVGADTTTNSGLSSTGVYTISARIVGYAPVIRNYINHPGYTSVSATAPGGINSFGSHGATSSVGDFGFNTPY